MLLAASFPTLSWADVALRLVLAGALGSAVGLERELREHEAGLRTHLLVALGSALFTLASGYGFHEWYAAAGTRIDPTRIAAQIVSGIGFLGAGAILRQGGTIRGLTTAASLWVVAAIGLAAGAGYYEAALVTTGLVVFALWPLRYVARNVVDRVRPEEQRLVVELRPEATAAQLLGDVHAHGFAVRAFELDDERDRRVVMLHLDHAVGPLVPALSDLDYVVGVRWRK